MNQVNVPPILGDPCRDRGINFSRRSDYIRALRRRSYLQSRQAAQGVLFGSQREGSGSPTSTDRRYERVCG